MGTEVQPQETKVLITFDDLRESMGGYFIITILVIPSIGDPQQAVIPRVLTGFLCHFAVI